MIWDNLSIGIIVRLIKSELENNKLSTWDIACEFFKTDLKDKLSKQRFYSTKTMAITARLKMMQNNGLLTVEKNSRIKNAVINNERVKIKRMKIMENRLREYLCVKDKRDKWDIFEI